VKVVLGGEIGGLLSSRRIDGLTLEQLKRDMLRKALFVRAVQRRAALQSSTCGRWRIVIGGRSAQHLWEGIRPSLYTRLLANRFWDSLPQPLLPGGRWPVLLSAVRRPIPAAQELETGTHSVLILSEQLRDGGIW